MSKRDSDTNLSDAVKVISSTPSVRPLPADSPALGADEIAFLRRFVANVPDLRRAWVKLANANVEHLKVIRAIERRFVWLLAIALLQSVIVLVGIGAAVKFNNEARAEAHETRKAVNEAARALGGFLEAQGATNRAISTKVQADVTRDPVDEQKAIEAAVVAEKETLDARRQIAPTEQHPAIDREAREVERKLKRVELRAKAIESE